MNVRLQKYKQNRLAGMDKYNAARAAGYSHNTAWNAYNNIEKRCPDMREAFLKAGITDEVLTQHAVEGMKATREIVSDGKVIDERPDWQTRHKYFSSISKMTDRLTDKVQVDVDVKVQVTHIEIEERLRCYQSAN